MPVPKRTSPRAIIIGAVAEHRGKRSKQDVMYENPARNKNRHCGPTGRPGRCAHFVRPSGCTEVAGNIAPTGWCYLWSAVKET